MGGGSYSRSMGNTSSSSSSWRSRNLSYTEEAQQVMEHNSYHTELLPMNRDIECKTKDPIVIAMDVTRSRGDDSKIIYDKMPMIFGQIIQQGYLKDPSISFAAIGDAKYGDAAPLQVCDFEKGIELDQWLTKIWLEEGGGGTGQESYELAAYYYARHCKMPKLKNGKKGFFFFTGDEGFYDNLEGDFRKLHIGDANRSITTKKIFEELQKKFHVFFLFPKKKWEDRKSDIDAEIQKRLQRAGAHDGVIQFSFIWNNRNDLDIHAQCPCGTHIFYGNKKCLTCGGWLDVDRNVSGETLKPVENMTWQNPIPGTYKIWIENFALHGRREATTNFKVEQKIHGQIKHYNKSIGGRGDRVPIVEFKYSGGPLEIDAEAQLTQEQAYANYDDEKIYNQWSQVIPQENILILDEPKAVGDTILGVIALGGGSRTLAEYIIDMQGRGRLEGQTTERIESVSQSLKGLNKSLMVVPEGNFKLPQPSKNTKRRSVGSQRL